MKGGEGGIDIQVGTESTAAMSLSLSQLTLSPERLRAEYLAVLARAHACEAGREGGREGEDFVDYGKNSSLFVLEACGMGGYSLGGTP